VFAGMHVYISDPGLLPNLQSFLRGAEFVAEQRRSDELEVFVPRATDESHARRELNEYLAAWQAMNLGVDAYIVDTAPAR
jgi:hypothetical protein